MPHARARYATTIRWLARTTVRRGASIGAAAVVLPALEIGRYAVIAAGAVVTNSVPPFALMVGTPARQLGWVCRCGQPLDGEFDEATCSACGETPADRLKEQTE